IFFLLYHRNCRLVKKLNAFSFLTLHIESKMDILWLLKLQKLWRN
ncbi:hypothetical protein Gotur_003017, partial [Gossypium turneri]